jgi:hypothetical protein
VQAQRRSRIGVERPGLSQQGTNSFGTPHVAEGLVPRNEVPAGCHHLVDQRLDVGRIAAHRHGAIVVKVDTLPPLSTRYLHCMLPPTIQHVPHFRSDLFPRRMPFDPAREQAVVRREFVPDMGPYGQSNGILFQVLCRGRTSDAAAVLEVMHVPR